MSAEAAAVVHKFAVGKRVCTLTFPKPKPGSALAMASEWAPTVPEKLSDSELAQYRAGRDRAIAKLGLKTLVVEI